jgi:hypothetical protein
VQARETDPALILALFEDATVIVSLSGTGGPPFTRGRLSNSRLNAVMALLRDTVDTGVTNQGYVPPDAGYLTMRISISDEKDGQVCFQSSHENYESANVVATQNGLVAVEERSKTAIMRSWSKEYEQFRKTWAALRMSVQPSDILDSTTQPSNGVLLVHGGKQAGQP